MGQERKDLEPAMDNLPQGYIDWAEISNFIEDILNAQWKAEKGWKMIHDTAATEKLQNTSVLVLNQLCEDLYEFFYKQREDRNVVWARMERFIRAKYGKLSDKALSRIIATYHNDDR